MAPSSALRVLVTGAGGNLGQKLVATLASSGACSAILALDLASPPVPTVDGVDVRSLGIDLTTPSAALDAAFSAADAVVHLAARNPYPDANWADGAASFDMTLNAVEALGRCGPERPRRFVFASSNHVMGGYKEADVPPGTLSTALPPRPGTRSAGQTDVPRAYAASKLMGERLLAAKAAVTPGFTAVSLRIGWCQPGANHPATLSASGVPGATAPPAGDGARDLLWFRSMWLSDRDFARAVLAALAADAGVWPSRAVVVNAMSDNAGMPWDLAAARDLIGYAPRDDVWRALVEAAGPPS